MVDPVIGWFEVAQYNDNRAISIVNSVETTWLSKQPRLMEITYDQGKELIVHEFRKYLIEMEYGITSKPHTSGNITSNVVLERIHQVLGNLMWTCNITQTYVE